MPNRWRDILDSLRKSGSRELKEGVYQLCSYYQCTLFERSPLWYLVHNQMIQKKRFPAGLRYKYLLWRIWLVPPYALVNMLSLSSRAGRHMRKNANKHIYLKKVCIYHFSWWNVQMKADSVSSNICLGQFVLTGCGWMEGKPFMQTICYTATITQMVLQKTTNTGKFVTSCLVVTWERSSHSGDNASQIVWLGRKGLTPCFVGTNFSAAFVCHRRQENIWRQVIGVMEAKIRSELEGVSGPLTSFFSSLEALVVKSKLHTYYCDSFRT